MILKACFENETSLQAKVVVRIRSKVLYLVVFIGQEKRKFFLLLASLVCLKLELGCGY